MNRRISAVKVLMAGSVLVLGACQSTPTSLVSRYVSDPEAQERLYELEPGSLVALIDFSTDVLEPGRDTCRSQPIRLPRGETLAEYIRSAFETEFYPTYDFSQVWQALRDKARAGASS